MAADQSWIAAIVSARIAAHPIGVVALAAIRTSTAALAVLYSTGNGLLIIARGTVPLAIFGPLSYAERTGLLGAPARAAQDPVPFVFGLLLYAIVVSAFACCAAFCAAYV